MAERKDIIRTRKAIWQAYLDLCKEKPYAQMTASDVIKKAEISRGTFYAHYKDINDLREEIEKDFCSMTSEALLPFVRHLYTDTERALFHIFRFFEKNRSMVYAVTAQGSLDTYYHACRKQLGKDILRCAYTGEENDRVILKAVIFADMIVDQCREVVNEETSYTIAERAEIMCEMLREGIPS